MKNFLFTPRAAVYAGIFIVLLLLPKMINAYHLSLVETGLSLAIMALGLNLLLRYTGVLSFGIGAYFAAGAYAVGMLNMYWPEYYTFETAILASILVSAAISALFGFVCVRHTRIFFSILPQAHALGYLIQKGRNLVHLAVADFIFGLALLHRLDGQGH